MMSSGFKILTVVFLMLIFFVKMTISLAPVFLKLDNKAANTVAVSPEHDPKTDKDDSQKDLLKEKKIFDETCFHSIDHIVFLAGTSVFYNRERSHYLQVYHSAVPTPPPNV